VLSIAVGIPAIFWLKFRVVDGYALAFTTFLLMLVFAIEFVPKLSDEYGAELEAKPVEPRWYDRLGVVWLLSIPFAPFLGWVVKSVASLSATLTDGRVLKANSDTVRLHAGAARVLVLNAIGEIIALQ
jgi:hypothetical protein